MPPDDDRGDPLVRGFTADDLDTVVALDRAATGGDRAALLRELVTPASAIVAVDHDGVVRGYLARAPFRGGGVIAPDPEDALRLLERRRHATVISGKAGAGLMSGNTVGRERLRAAGWHEELGGVRMHRGEPLEWDPNAIWGQFSGALG